MNTKNISTNAGLLTMFVMLFLLLGGINEEAQAAPGNGNQLGSQQDKPMTGSTDAMQRGVGTEVGDTAASQDRDRLQDPSLHVGNEDPVQDRDRIQDQTHIPEGAEPAQNRAAEQMRLHTAQDLEQYVQEQNRVRTQKEDAPGTQVQTRTEARVAADAIEAAESLLGRNATRMSTVAQEMNRAMDGLAEREEVLQNRSRLQLFLFGQDDEVVETMQQEMERNQNRIEEMKQYMLNCEDCDGQVTQILVNQIQNMEQEQNRVQEVVDEAGGRAGVLGFLFGWMR